MNQTFTVENSLQNLCQVLGGYYGMRLKNYGEATESLQADSAGNYISIKDKTFCSVDDAYDVTLFFVRENATTNNQPAGGRKGVLTRNVSFKIVVNSKHPGEEFAISTLVNTISHMTYGGSDFDSKAIALQYFGLPERNFETYFFTLDIEVLEKITCQPC
jgi:hypothetical protein